MPRANLNELILPWQHLLAVGLLIALGGAIYANTTGVPFYLDDRASIADNRYMRVDEWSVSKFADAAFEARSDRGNKRPVAYLSFALNYYFGEKIDNGEPTPRGFHITNTIIHIATGILTYLLAVVTFRLWNGLRRKAGEETALPVFLASLFAACLFVAHPIQTQAITYVVQRMASLATMFFLAALLLFVVGRIASRKPVRYGCWSAAALSGLLALGTKQTAVTLPLMILLYEWFFFRDLDAVWFKRAMLRFVLPAVAVVVALGLYFTHGDPFSQIAKGYEQRNFTMGERLLTQPRVILFHLSQVLVPLPQRFSLLHSMEFSHSLIRPWTTVPAIALLGALFATAIATARRHRAIAFGILWVFITLALESSFLALEMIYEHRFYLPMFGIALIAANLLALVPLRHRQWATVAGVLVVLFCALSTVQRNAGWQQRLAFWEQLSVNADALSAAVIEDNRFGIARIHNNYGQVLTQDNRMLDADVAFSKAVAIDPTYPQARYNYGIRLMQKGDFDAALEQLGQAIEYAPDYSRAFFVRGNLHQSRGRMDEAIADYTSAIEATRDDSRAHYERGQLYEKLKQFDLAIADFTETARLEPRAPEPFEARARCYRLRGQPGDAEAAKRDLLQVARLRQAHHGGGS